MSVGVVLAATAGSAAQDGAGPAVFDCVIDPSDLVEVGSPVNGILSEVTVERGDIVGKGDVVATLDNELERVALEFSRIRAASTAEIDAQIARNDLVRRDLERTEELVRRNVSTEQQLETLTAELEVGLRELDRLKLQRQLAQLDVARAEKLLEQRILRSPVDGVVHERVLSGGEFVSQQSHVMVIAELDPLLVETFLPVEYFTAIKVGQPAMVRTDGAITGTFAATVTVIDRVFDAASRTFGVRLELPNPNYALPAGQVCEVSF